MDLLRVDRVRHSCFRVMDEWTEILDQGGCLDAIYLDFSKAFDKVPHRRLLMKLENYGITGKVLKWIQSFLINRRQRVRIGKASRSRHGWIVEYRRDQCSVQLCLFARPTLMICQNRYSHRYLCMRMTLRSVDGWTVVRIPRTCRVTWIEW